MQRIEVIEMKLYKLNDGIMLPLVLIILMVCSIIISSYASRFVIKINTLDNLEQYYYSEIIKEIKG